MNSQATQLRRELKQRRKALSESAIKTASNAIARNVWRLPEIQRARNIGIYLAAFGEVDCQPFIERAWLRGKRTFAPILRRNHMLFAPLGQGSTVVKNRFGIREPTYTRSQLLAACRLDVVLVPLVAFDSVLNRVGMGGGFYDRSFAFTKRRPNFRRPRLVGLGYSFQHVDSIHAAPWDVPLDRAVTETQCLPTL